MSTLRSRIIRLAKEQPDLRKDLLPLLKSGNWNNGDRELKPLHAKCQRALAAYGEAYPAVDLASLKGDIAFSFYTDPQNLDAERAVVVEKMDKAERAIKEMRLHLADLRELTTTYYDQLNTFRKPNP